MKKLILIPFLLIFTLTYSFSNENVKTNTQNTISTQENNNTDDEFNDDFDEEFNEAKDDFDPLSGYNRVMTDFNDFVYINVLDPTAKGYAYVVPQEARVGVNNIIQNLLYPVRLLNNLLQLKFENAATETGRFILNSTFGLAGIIDVAGNEFGWEQKDEDFGQTLAFYGVGEGFHVVLPLLGPSNLRDMSTLVVDAYVSPLSDLGRSDIKYKIPTNTEKTVGLSVFRAVNKVSLHPDEYQNIKKDAIDLYPFLKEVYNQSREKKIKE